MPIRSEIAYLQMRARASHRAAAIAGESGSRIAHTKLEHAYEERLEAMTTELAESERVAPIEPVPDRSVFWRT